jgi:hypothetical protein
MANGCALVLAGLLLALVPTARGGPEGYMDHEALSAAVHALATDRRCTVDVIGSSRGGRGLFVLTLSEDPATAGNRPALLLAAGLDGRHLVGTEIAVRVARRLLADHADLLDEMTVYVVPRVNPDAAEASFLAPDTGHSSTFRVVDDDHDGEADEDGPDDLDGNGVITMMRRPHPPLDDAATHLADPGAPRLLKEADRAKGERAIYAVYTEGLDTDGDGAVAEDGPGGVDLDRNFMHRWPEHARDAGPYQLSEPESAALAKFVLEHPRIVAAIAYGRHDNLVNVPSGKGSDDSGRGPKDLDPDDVAIYEELSKRFVALTDQERAPARDTAGSFHAWLYAQRGVPSLATVVWGRPDASAEPEAEAGEPPEEGPDGDDEDGDEDAEPADAEAAAWLDYSDRDRAGSGFVEWTPFDHPTLGGVEIGGFRPGFRLNPPADELETLADGQAAFAVEVIGRRPVLSFEGPTVKTLAPGLHEVRFGVVNDGMLPTATAIARKARSFHPTVVRISTDLEDIVAGERVIRTWGIEGSGGRAAHHWIVRAETGTEITLQVHDRQLGDRAFVLTAP